MARIVDSTNQLVAPRWAGDFGSPDLGLMRGGFRLDAAQWEERDYTITATEVAAIAAVSITVAALPVAVPAGTDLSFDGVAARTSADAAIGATALPVEALEVAVADNATAVYTAVDTTPVTVVSGTPVGRTLAERDAGDQFGPADAADDEIYLIYFDVQDASINPDFVAYRPYAGRIVKENFLPGFDDLAAGVVTALRTRYTMIRGAD